MQGLMLSLGVCYGSNNHTPPSPIPPREHPQHDRHTHARRTAPRPALKAVCSLTLRIASHTRHSRSGVTDRVDDAPERRTTRRHHGDHAPVGSEVLDAPDDADDDWDERKGGAVAEAEESRRGEEEGWVGGDEGRQGEDEEGEEEEDS